MNWLTGRTKEIEGAMYQVQPPVSIITTNPEMLRILAELRRIAGRDCPVLLTGETGTGKELLTEYLHYIGKGANRSLIKVNLATIPPDLLASELFGHEKGAFTGAQEQKKGLIEAAHNGTLFLDDIDDLPLEVQVKLLRVLENKHIRRLGATKDIPVHFRLVCASKTDLRQRTEQKRFRADLYYRISTFPVRIPPLRRRTEDIPLLFNHFFGKYSEGKRPVINRQCLDWLVRYPWPGNVRELRNIAHRLSLTNAEMIHFEDLPREIRTTHTKYTLGKQCSLCHEEQNLSLPKLTACLEVNMIKRAMEVFPNNQSAAARYLGLSLSTFRDKARKYHLLKPAASGIRH